VTTPTLRLTDASVTTAPVDALVVGTMSGQGGPRLVAGSAEVNAAFDGALADLLALLGARGKADEVIKVPTRGAISAPLLVATGLGEVDGEPTSEQVRSEPKLGNACAYFPSRKAATESNSAAVTTPWPPRP
jgi:leucyl aminopeptidase